VLHPSQAQSRPLRDVNFVVFFDIAMSFPDAGYTGDTGKEAEQRPLVRDTQPLIG
jgi:hypothetical protein